MKIIAATLIADGSSDRTLLPIIQFLLDEWSPYPHRIAFADNQHDGSLSGRISRALDLFPCDILFVHRDAEAMPREEREKEIEAALSELKKAPKHICVVPVRMTESWLIHDEAAIRVAAGNPKGTVALGLPGAKAIERHADPKSCLFEALLTAAEVTGRRRKQFRPEAVRHRVAELMDLEALRKLPSFKAVEDAVQELFRSSASLK